MKKNIEWLKEEIGELPCVDTVFNSDGSSYIDSAVPVMAVYDLINQLDEPEVLTQEWIDNNSVYASFDGLTGEYVHVDDLQNLLLPKQEILSQEWIDEHRESTFDLDEDEDFETVFVRVKNLQNLLVPKQELPVIPTFVANWIEDYKEREDIYTALSNAFEGMESAETYNWVSGYTGVANQETFAKAWLDGYTVEEEQKYYAKLKEVKPPKKEWLTNLSGPKYYVIDAKGLMLGEFLLDLTGMKTEADTYTLKDWERYGINNSNADFEQVEELEE